MRGVMLGVPLGLMPPIFVASRDHCLEIGRACATVASETHLSRAYSIEEVVCVLQRLFPIKQFDAAVAGRYRREPLSEAVVRSLMLEGFFGPKRDDIGSILEAHRRLMVMAGGVDCRSSFRTAEALVGVTTISAHGFVAPCRDMKAEVRWLMAMLQSERWGFLEAVSMFLWYFLHVHPFRDGNGRMSRLLLLRLVSTRWGAVSEYHSVLSLLDFIERHRAHFIYSMHRTRVSDHGEFIDLLRKGLGSRG